MSKMAIVTVQGRTHTPISWASGDQWACVVATKIASEISDPRVEIYWRKATAQEFAALEQQRKASKSKSLPGW